MAQTCFIDVTPLAHLSLRMTPSIIRVVYGDAANAQFLDSATRLLDSVRVSTRDLVLQPTYIMMYPQLHQMGGMMPTYITNSCHVTPPDSDFPRKVESLREALKGIS